MKEKNTIRVFITDDHQLVIDGLKLMLTQASDMICIGEASDGQMALDQLARMEVDVVLLDINMPNLNGMDACRIIKERHPKINILVLSMLQEANLIRQMIKNGANGYLLKNAGQDEVLTAIRTVAKGANFYGETVKDIILNSLAGGEKKSNTNPFPKISRREKQVLALIVDEHTTQEIADQLHISFGTVETHRRNLLIKLGARNTAGLVRACLEYNLLDN